MHLTMSLFTFVPFISIADLLSIGRPGFNFSEIEIWIAMQKFSSKQMCLDMSSAK